MAVLPTYLELPEATLVYGYLEPCIPLEQQLTTVFCRTMDSDRYLQSRYERPWYELYSGEKPIIVGHHDYLMNRQAFIYQECIFGLDTSCVHGKMLTGLLLPNFNIFSVPSRGDLWNGMRKQYRLEHPAAKIDKSRAKKTCEPAPLDKESQRLLQAILDLASQENERALARLCEHPNFGSLTPRQQAKAYSAEIATDPLAVLMHMARKGELSLERARRVLKDAALVLSIAKQVGIR